MRSLTKQRFLATLFALIASACMMSMAQAATITVPGMQPDIQSAINVASPGDQILVAPGTYLIGTTINVTVANLTIQGSGISSTTLQVAQAVGNMFSIQAAGSGTTIRDFKIQKTDVAGLHEIIWINANNVTVRDNEIFGPDPGTPWSVNNIVSRAMVVSPGLTGLLIQGNTIHHLRQPAYIDGPAGVTRGSILNNNVSGTRGWVLAGAKMVISGNTWGPPENQGAEIALLSTCTPVDYPSLIALSSANNNAYISAQWVGAESGRATTQVDDSAAPGGFGSVSAPYQTVSTGMANTLTDGTVQVAAGSYTEQVVVSKNLTIQGAGRASTTILSPATLTASFTTSGVNKPVVLIQNASNVIVRDLAVDANGVGNANSRLQGVAYRNAGGKLLDCDVLRVRNTPLDGAQGGVGIYGGNSSGSYSLEVGGTNVLDFQKNGTVFDGAGYTVNMHDCTVTGAGPTGVTAQNGIQISNGASGTVTNCAVSGIYWTGPTWTATGQLFYSAGTVNVAGGSVTGCQTGTYYQDTNGQMTNTNTTTPFGGGTGAVGVVAYNSSASIVAQMRTGETGRTRPVAQPYDDGAFAARAPANATASLITLTMDGGCLTGPGTADAVGVEAYTEGGGMTVNVSHMEISNWGYGILGDGTSGGPTVNADHNAIAGNITDGYYGGLGSHTAQLNWWGNAGGPGVGGANPVAGVVTYAPWLVSAADANPGCGFAPGPDNLISAGPAPSCISVANTCIAIPVTIARTTSDNVRGYSVTLQLSANLALCSPNIVQGTYLSSIGGTNFQVTNNGGGNYTVDCAILGTPCGATASSGGLFTINVKKNGPDGTGTITLGPVLMRNCDNVPVAASAGPTLNITVDTAAPAAISDLSATQKPSGNGAVSTTGVLLTWSTGGAGAVSLYRAPFGSYPEYDDDGAVTPPVAATAPGGPWVLVNSNATSPYNDAAAARGYWYYVAFVTDACGNVSAVSNMTGGTLNYLLGDVTPALGAGDNKVDGLDISALGASYGISGEGLVDAVGYLDVGPTLTGAANARPKPDDKINFEDLMIFSINYGGTGLQVVEPGAGPVADADAITVSAPAKVSGGGTFTVELRMKGAGDIQGVTSQLAWDAGVAAPVSVTAGDLVTAANGVAFSAQPGNVDVALLGSRHHGLSGDGVLAVVTFRALTSGDPKVSLARVEARDASNRPVTLSGVPQGAATPGETTLFPVTPNPFRKDAVLGFSLAKDGPVELAIYSVDGRRVSTVAAGTRSAGVYRLSWNGTDANGAQVGAGMYYARLTVGGVKLTRRLVYIK